MIRHSLTALLLSIGLTSSVNAVEGDPTCTSQPQEIGRDMRILGFEGKFVGNYQSTKPVFYNIKLETLYIFEDGLNSIPLEIPWTQATDLRWKSHTKSFSDYKSEGIKSYLTSLGIRCGISSVTEHPQNSAVISTAKASACADLGQSFPVVGGKCCEGLTYNPNTRTCDEPTFKDPDFKVCASDADCSGNMGCLPQNPTLMFSKRTDNEETNELYDFMRELMDEQMNESDRLEVGKSCSHSSQCASYSCDSGVCQEVKVCRYGEEGEKLSSQAQCNEAKQLIKNDQGICELSPEAKDGLFLGLYDEHTDLFRENPEAGKCQYNMNEGVKERTIQALKSIRAMEWLFSSISRKDSDDCFQVNSKLRDQIGKPLVETRKYLMQDFSLYYSALKKDYDTIKAALENNKDSKNPSDKQVEIHGAATKDGQESSDGEVLTENELATRQTSGYDSLMFMYRRNLLFQSYEKGMLINIDNIYSQLSGLSQAMAEWKDGASSWNLGDRQVSAFQCQAKYKKLTIKGWKTKHYSDISNRWTDYYEVTGSKELNLNPATDAKVMEQLKIIGNLEDDQEVMRTFNRKHYLLDPLMPGKTEAQGNLAFTSFGTFKNLKAGGLFGFLKKRDLRSPRYLKGVSVMQSYSGLREQFRERLIQFYKELKVNPEQTGFIFEPELISTDAVDCVDKMGKELDASDKCHEFNQYIEDITNYGMAHFLAYSYHTNSKYSDYFTNAQTWRRRLFNRLEVDLQNLHRYYEDIVKMRQQQITCLESLINHVSDEYINTGSSVSQGGNYYYDGGKYSGNSAGSAKVGGKIGTLSEASRQKYSFQPNVSAWRGTADSLIGASREDLNTSTLTAGQTNIDSGDVSSNTSALNKRREAMIAINKKLSERGVKVDDKASKLLSSLGLNTSSSAGAGRLSSGAGSSSSNSLSSNSGRGGLGSGSGFDMNYDANMNGDIRLDPNAQVASLAPNGLRANEGGSRLGGTGGISMSEGALANGSDSSLLNQDFSGLSDDEKGVIFSNIERTKGRYEPRESDTLFDVVSKAYVRNLDKILIRKKRIED